MVQKAGQLKSRHRGGCVRRDGRLSLQASSLVVVTMVGAEGCGTGCGYWPEGLAVREPGLLAIVVDSPPATDEPPWVRITATNLDTGAETTEDFMALGDVATGFHLGTSEECGIEDSGDSADACTWWMAVPEACGGYRGGLRADVVVPASWDPTWVSTFEEATWEGDQWWMTASQLDLGGGWTIEVEWSGTIS